VRDRPSQAQARDARDDQDHDQEEQAGNATSEVDVAGLPAGSEAAEEDPEPSIDEALPAEKLGAISGTIASELGRLQPTEATT
jgi:hypothetical protein